MKVNSDNKVVLVGIIGNKRNGKDTVADYLLEEANKVNIKGFKQPLALELKKLLSSITNLSLSDIEVLKELENVKTVGNNSVRKSLQELGQNVKEVTDNKDIWSILAFNSIKLKELEGFNLFIIPDIRFQHEINFFTRVAKRENYKFVLLKVNNPFIINKDKHISENEINFLPYDYLIKNDSNLKILKQKVIKIFYKAVKVSE